MNMRIALEICGAPEGAEMKSDQYGTIAAEIQQHWDRARPGA
ncbi:hypothetical protein [Hyphococcus luteus]|jgi:hypothetical protein|nr:hypothetical protein [Marinicaulis flavus]